MPKVMEKISFQELRDTYLEWDEAVIVFTEDSFDKVYTEKQRSYRVRSDAKYFNPNMIGRSLYGDCLDGTEEHIRLDRYLGGWQLVNTINVDYCYIVITKEECSC